MFAVAAVKGLIRVCGGHIEEVHDGRRDSVSVTFPSFRCTAKFQHGLSSGPVFDANRFVVADKYVLTGLLAEDVVMCSPLGGEPVTSREAAVEAIRTINKLAVDDSYDEVLSGDTHHAAHYRLQVRDAAINGIFFVLLDADGKIAEVTIFWRPLPDGVELQRELADALSMQPWELRTDRQ